MSLSRSAVYAATTRCVSQALPQVSLLIRQVDGRRGTEQASPDESSRKPLKRGQGRQGSPATENRSIHCHQVGPRFGYGSRLRDRTLVRLLISELSEDSEVDAASKVETLIQHLNSGTSPLP